ncbi:MAG: phenylalanine--tRNA ligase subunit beta [Planctomycetia bacterium]|nr:phenylalanine--tRNA ligase subunit beta [Planctomycetia bacterium]
MIISTNWLADYVQIEAPTELLVERLLLSGLNHESTTRVGEDTAVEIEVTSNRPDCLGHLGVAREAAVLFSRPLHVPDPRPPEKGGPVAAAITIEIRSPELCPFYTARVIRGVRVGPSPRWLVERLRTVGVESVNSIVDVTNYVMLECGQPLHAFDLGRIRGGRIVVRRAAAGESFTAINHKTYQLGDRMCVIADAEGPVALAGVMGGAGSEIGDRTTDVLLESAQFMPLAVRAAARGLVLSSPSSYRFERVPDPAAVDWAGRRAASLILDLAGGTLDGGVATAGCLSVPAASVDLRDSRVAEVLGIDVPADRQHAILRGLGFVEETAGAGRSRWRCPSWRRDVSREIDLVEEIGRIEGYDRVREDEPITVRPVEVSSRERTIRLAAEVLVAAGFCEAMTRSVVSEALEQVRSPWGDATPLAVSPALVRGADRLRRTLLPSLLEARSLNLAVGAPHGDLFEIARGYLPRAAAGVDSPLDEPLLAALVTGGGFPDVKGIAEAVLTRLGLVSRCGAGLARFRPVEIDLLDSGRSAEIVLEREGSAVERVGIVGEAAADVLRRFGLEPPVGVVELRLDRLEFALAVGHPLRRPSDFPAIQRDLNLVVADAVPWGDITAAIREAAGDLLEECRLVQVWRDAERLGAANKSVVVSLRLRSGSGTLSGEDARRAVERILEACGQRCGATLRA